MTSNEAAIGHAIVLAVAVSGVLGMMPGLAALAEEAGEDQDPRLEGSELGAWFLEAEDQLEHNRTRDASQNDLHLNTTGDPTFTQSPDAAFGEGYDVGPDLEQRLERTSDDALEVTGDLSIFLAFNLTTSQKQALISQGDSAGGIRDTTYSLFVDHAGDIMYRHTGPSGLVELHTDATLDPGFHTLWLTRDTTTGEIRVGIDGEHEKTLHYNPANDPTPSTSEQFQLGIALNTGPLGWKYTAPLDDALLEARVWDRAVDRADLESIADDGTPGQAPFDGCEDRFHSSHVEGCLNATDIVLEQVAPGADVADEEVAGHLERYAFDVGGPTVVLTCVVLEQDEERTDPCAEAGGQQRERVATLLDRTVARPEAGSQEVRVCEGQASLLTIAGGVENVPVLMPCEGATHTI